MHLHCYGFSFFYIYILLWRFFSFFHSLYGLAAIALVMIVANGEYQCARRVCDCINCVLRTIQVRERECTSAPHTTFVIDMKESPESSRNWYLHSQSCFLSSCRLNGEYDLALVDAILVGVCECLRAPECTWIYCTFSNHHQQRRLKIVVAYRMLYVDILIGCVYGFSFEYHGINHAYAVYNLISVCVPIYTGNHSHSALSVAIKLK